MQPKQWQVALVTSLFIPLASVAHAQEAATPKPEHRFLSKTNLALFAADTVVRALDAQSTRRVIGNPCKCFVEHNVAFAASSDAKMYSYSLGISSAYIAVSYLAHRTHHHKYERALQEFDIPFDGHYVVGNYMLRIPNAPLAVSRDNTSIQSFRQFPIKH